MPVPQNMQLIDSHAHIDFPEFDDDREAMLDRARVAGVETILAIGSGAGPEKLDAAIPYAEQHDWIYASIGVHPHEAKDVTSQRTRSTHATGQASQSNRLGRNRARLFLRSLTPRRARPRFPRSAVPGASAKLPIIIHCRDAWPDTLKVLDEAWRPTGLGGILHCFTGTLEDAQRGLDMGFLISFAGNSTYPKAANIRDVAKALPLENILIETDSPFLAPQGFRGKRNEPAYVAEVAKAIASVRNLHPEDIAAATTANFQSFFKLRSSAGSGP